MPRLGELAMECGPHVSPVPARQLESLKDFSRQGMEKADGTDVHPLPQPSTVGSTDSTTTDVPANVGRWREIVHGWVVMVSRGRSGQVQGRYHLGPSSAPCPTIASR